MLLLKEWVLREREVIIAWKATDHNFIGRKTFNAVTHMSFIWSGQATCWILERTAAEGQPRMQQHHPEPRPAPTWCHHMGHTETPFPSRENQSSLSSRGLPQCQSSKERTQEMRQVGHRNPLLVQKTGWNGPLLIFMKVRSNIWGSVVTWFVMWPPSHAWCEAGLEGNIKLWLSVSPVVTCPQNSTKTSHVCEQLRLF